MHTPRMHKRFLIGQSFVGYAALFDMAALALVALAQRASSVFRGCSLSAIGGL